MSRFAIVNRMCVALVVISPCLTSETHAQPQRRGLPAPQEIVLPPSAVKVPMLRYERLPLIEVTINGKGPFRLVLDTGASGVLLSKDHADSLSLPSPPGMPAGMKTQVMTPGGPIAATLAYIDELRIDDVQIRGIWTIVTELPFGEAIDGVIGMNLFRSGLLTYDYPGGRFVLSQGELPEVNNRDVFAYRTPQNSGSHPTINLTIGDKPVEFLIDTGFGGWFSVPATFAQQLSITAGPVDSRMGLAVGGSMRQRIARVASVISIGRYSVNRPVVQIQPEGGDSPMPARKVVGTSFLEHFVVTIDGTNNRIQLANGPEAPMTPPAVRYLGLGLKQVGQQMEIWAVHPDSNAKTLGLSEGDRIHAFNGRPAAKLYRSDQWRKLLRTADTITVTYAPGGSGPTRDVELRILELLPASSVTVGQKRSEKVSG